VRRYAALGLGVVQAPPGETRAAVRAPLDCGYRLIDTPAAYGNEAQVDGIVTQEWSPIDGITA